MRRSQAKNIAGEFNRSYPVTMGVFSPMVQTELHRPRTEGVTEMMKPAIFPTKDLSSLFPSLKASL